MSSESLTISIEAANLDRNGVLFVGGWAAGPDATESIEIVVEGARIGRAAHGRARPDVAADHPDFPDAALSGFELTVQLPGSLRGARDVYVVVHTAGGKLSAATSPILVEGAALEDALRFHCDRVAVYDDGEIEFIGWAAHVDAVAAISVHFDGVALGEAKIGGLRPDVGTSLPDIPSAAHSGFEFHVRLDDIGAGEHEIDLVVSTRKGERLARQLKAATQIAHASERAAERDDIRFFIDSPQIADGALVQPVGRLLSIEGWAIARHGIAAIELYVDGAPVGAASRGVRRLDIGAGYPTWPESLTSGFAAMLPRRLFAGDKHKLRIAVRDRRGAVKSLEASVNLAAPELDDERFALRRFVFQAEVDLKTALIAAASRRLGFCVLVSLGGEPDLLQATLASLDAQVFGERRVALIAPPGGGAGYAGVTTLEADPRLDLAAAAAGLWSEAGARELFVMCLRAGDTLGCDALMELALELVTRGEEDFLYADDRRPDGASSHFAPFLKPEWSPDLLLSTNYVGRAWCASLDLVRRAQLPLDQMLARGDYDLVLRLTEAAREIGRAPVIIAETLPADTPERELTALSAAMERRSLEGGVRTTAAPGVYRLRRRVKTRGLVSIVIPTIASGGLIERCLASLRAHTAYIRYEIVCVDNIRDEDSPWKAWLKTHADCVVEYPGAFNWSKLNNLGASAALGEFLLFLNDDVEATDPRWLHALLEHGERDEVGVVGPRLLYPDGRVQHAGMFLVERNARHAFRFAESDDPGGFGLAAASRNVAAVTGACMLMRRETFETIGGFNERHAIVNNDVDLCLRLWSEGLRVVYTPHATLIHHEMASRVELEDSFDEHGFDTAWRPTFALGDPFFNPRLSRDDNDYAPDPEPARAIVAGGPLMARENVRRILVQKLDHIGDFITGLPAIRRLKLRFPEASIHLLAPSASAALASWEPAISEVIEFNFFHQVSGQGRRELDAADWLALEAQLRPYAFDIAVDLRKHTETREALKHSGARLTAGFDHRGQFPWLDVALEWDSDQPYLAKRTQVGEDYVNLVEAVSLACESERGLLDGPTPEAALAALRALPKLNELRPGLFDRPLVGVHPASGNALRQWPAEHFAQLIDLICDAFEVNFVLLGAASEASVAEAVLEETRARARVWSLVGLNTLDELPMVMRALKLFVGNNSGPHHIAAALGVPTVGVHSGVVSAREWGPLGPRAVAVQREMTCGPCYLAKPTSCPRGLACLYGLRPGEVFRVCEQMLGAALRL